MEKFIHGHALKDPLTIGAPLEANFPLRPTVKVSQRGAEFTVAQQGKCSAGGIPLALGPGGNSGGSRHGEQGRPEIEGCPEVVAGTRSGRSMEGDSRRSLPAVPVTSRSEQTTASTAAGAKTSRRSY
jgi:hypothetical protein